MIRHNDNTSKLPIKHRCQLNGSICAVGTIKYEKPAANYIKSDVMSELTTKSLASLSIILG